MNNTNRYFRGQMEDEEVIIFSRKHWATTIPQIIPFAIFIGCIVLGVILLKKIVLPSVNDPLFQSLVLLVIVASGYTIHRFFLHMINYFNTVVIITNLRIVEIKKTIFLNHTIESIDIKKIQDVEFKQKGLVKNLLKLGDIYITLGNSEIKTIMQLSNPDFHFRLINKLKNEGALRQQRPLNQMQNGTNACSEELRNDTSTRFEINTDDVLRK